VAWWPADGMNQSMPRRADEGGFGYRQAGQAKGPAAPSRQQRHRCRRQNGAGRPGDGGQRRGEQQEPGGLAGLEVAGPLQPPPAPGLALNATSGP
jgi:hypothetical protein